MNSTHLDGMAISPTCVCVGVCVFAPCRALGIRHYYLRESMRNSVNIDRERERAKERDEPEI